MTWARTLLAHVLAPQSWRNLLRRSASHTFTTPAQHAILHALVQGAHLKSHRTVDGTKDYCLHRADGSILRHVHTGDVDALREAGLIVGNMKFPAATYLLTQAGLRIANTNVDTNANDTPPLQPLTPR